MLALVAGRDVRILSEEGSLLGRFVIDPAEKYQANCGTSVRHVWGQMSALTQDMTIESFVRSWVSDKTLSCWASAPLNTHFDSDSPRSCRRNQIENLATSTG